MVTFDAADPGTPVDEWTSSRPFDSMPEFDLGGIRRLTVVAAHPDDETLGAGGLIAEAARRGVPVQVIVVTDGSASHPDSSMAPAEIAAMRSREVRAAVAELAPSATVVELGIPDGATVQHRERIETALEAAIPARSAIACPWRGDGHRDHRVVGEVCAAIAGARGDVLLEYPIWMWHWGDPRDETIPWQQARATILSSAERAAKYRAVQCHASQVRGPGSHPGDSALLRPDFLAHFDRHREVYFVTQPHDRETKSEAYFDGLYERSDDPWRLSTRWYERRKRAISVASLPRERYGSALEIGCSVGELTALLAERCDQLLALDISAAAVAAARLRTADLPQVIVEHRDATRDFPEGHFDLVVLSEVGYYFDRTVLRDVIRQIAWHLTSDGTLLACHWRHPVADYPLLGDDVHAVLRETTELTRVAVHEEDDFILEIYGRGESAASVAAQEGFLR